MVRAAQMGKSDSGIKMSKEATKAYTAKVNKPPSAAQQMKQLGAKMGSKILAKSKGSKWD